MEQRSGLFNTELISSQLISSCCIAYQQLMKTGFPSQMEISKIFDKFKQNQDQCESTNNRKQVCSELLRSCGLNWPDFKVGNTKIFFRNGKLDILSEKLNGDLELIINRHRKLKMVRAKWRILIIVTRLCSIRKI